MEPKRIPEDLVWSALDENQRSTLRVKEAWALAGDARAADGRARSGRPEPGPWVRCLLLAGAGLAAVLLVPASDPRYPEVYGFVRAAGWIALALGVVAAVAVLVNDARARRAIAMAVPTYLAKIRYDELVEAHRRRAAPGSARDTPGERRDYWATGNYDPERYYRETRHMSSGYREYVRDAYGDLDTYESNMPD